jgi:glycerol-3-phosphate dehydrogenase
MEVIFSLNAGYRYFQQIFEPNFKFHLKKENYHLVKESVEERDVVINNSPHTTRYIGLCVPCRNVIMACYFYVGLWMYHQLSLRFLADTSEFACPAPKMIGVDEMKRNFPLLNPKYNWGVVVYDGEMDDSRLLMETLLTSTVDNYKPGMKGANVLNYATFENFIKDSNGKIVGIEFYDKVRQKKMTVRAKHVVNAAGNFSDVIRKKDDPNCKRRILHALGSHAILDGSFCSRNMGLLIPKTSDGRVLFFVPWLQSTIVGTTDFVVKEPAIHPTPTKDCISFIKKEATNLYPIFEEKPFEDFVRSKWSGIRPLVLPTEELAAKEDSEISSKDVARTHLILESNSGLISVMGGKWTIFRKMGEDTLLHILKRSNPNIKEVPKDSSTRNLRTIGDYRETRGSRLYLDKRRDHEAYIANFVKELYSRHSTFGLPLLNHLARSYGIRSLDVIDIASKNPKLLERVHPEFEVIKAELVYQIRKEMVVNVMDLLLRRNRIAFMDGSAAKAVMPTVIDILGDEVGWDVAAKKKHLAEASELYSKMEFN